MTLLVPEKLEPSSYRKLFSLLGTDYVLSSIGWLNFVIMIVLGIVIAYFAWPEDQMSNVVLIGIGYGLLIELTWFCHALGHILSSRYVGAPMKTVIITSTVYTGSFENNDVSKRQHIGRAIGGPTFNLLVGLIVLLVHANIVSNHYVLFFAVANIVLTVVALVPLPSLDGSVLLRELRKSS